jgi:hypothetical protein
MGGHFSKITESLAVPMWPQIDQIYGHETLSLKFRTKPTMTVFANKVLNIIYLHPRRRSLKNLNSEEIYEVSTSPDVTGTIKSRLSSLAAYEISLHSSTYHLFCSPNVVRVAFCLLNKQLHCLRNYTLNLTWGSALFLLSVYHSFGNHAPFK